MFTLRCPDCANEFVFDESRGDQARICPRCGCTVQETQPGEKAGRNPGREDHTRTWNATTAEAAPEGEKGRYVKVKSGDVLGGFRIEEMVGAGAMAVVYRAVQLSLDRHVALKILPRRFASNPVFVRQFESETAMLASLNHPNIISIIDRGHVGETYFFAMEYVEGTTLREMMRSGEITPELFVTIFRQCAAALKYAHSKDIIHRDIKPANIMLDDQGNVKVADFGVAGIIARGEQLEKGRRRVAGTPGYMAPEQQVDVRHTDARSDLFSLGAVMYQVLVHKLPDGPDPPPPSELAEDSDPRLDALVCKCLKADPDERFQNAQEFIDALDAYNHEITRIGEVCPQCKAENPVTEKQCLSCGADLADLFDVCPECGAENRRDVEICIGCGTDLKSEREKIAVMISKARNRAGYLMDVNRHGEAIEELTKILEVEGKLYEHHRRQARQMIDQCKEERRAHYRSVLEQGHALEESGKLPEAVEMWRSIPEDVIEEAQPAELVEAAESKMARCRAWVQEAGELMQDHGFEEAADLTEKVEQTWPDCPGLSDLQYQLQAQRQTEEMIQYEIQEVDQLLADSKFEAAREALAFSRSSMPDHPLVKQKLREIDRQERAGRIAAAVGAAKELEEKNRFRAATRKWEEAAGHMPENSPQRSQIMKRAAAARRQADESPEEEIEEEVPEAQEAEGARPRVSIQRGKKQRLSKPLMAGVLLVGALLAAAVLFGVYVVVKPGDGTNGKTDGGNQGGDGVAITENGTPKPKPKPKPKPPPQRYFREDFEDGTAKNWETTGRVQVSSEERKALRLFSSVRPASAVHRYYEEQDAGVEAWMRARTTPGLRPDAPSVALVLRKRGESGVFLRIHGRPKGAGEIEFEAWLAAVVDGKTEKQTQPVKLVSGPGPLIEAKVRVDAVGNEAAASVGEESVGVLRDLPASLVQAGQVGVEAQGCRAWWDEFVLEAGDPERIPAEVEVVKNGNGGEKPPETPKAKPLVQAASAPGVRRLALPEHSLSVKQGFDSGAEGWEPESGSWRQEDSGRYKVAPGGGVSSFTLGQFADLAARAVLADVVVVPESAGKSVGLFARQRDGKNYVFFGVAGKGKDEWTLQLVSVVGGKENAVEVPGGPYELDRNKSLDLRLSVVGDRACGYVGDRPVLQLTGLPGGPGSIALGGAGLGASYDSVEVTARQSVPLKGSPLRSPQGTVGLQIPDTIDAQAATPPAVLELGECQLANVFLSGLTARDARMTVYLKIKRFEKYPQFSLSGAAKGQRDVMVSGLIDFYKQGRAVVTLAGSLPQGGSVVTKAYDKKRITGVKAAETLAVTLSMQGDKLELSLAGKPVISYQGKYLPKEAGMWGFRATDMTATIQRIELEL